MVPTVAPMLAVPGVPNDGLEHYAVEPKLDGWRVIIRLDRVARRSTPGAGAT
jgi:hypothetical protein